MATPEQSQPDVQLACPVCSAFNSADFRFCPHCGHRLGAPDLVELPATRSRREGRLSTVLLLLLLLAVGVELGWRSALWQYLQTFLTRDNPSTASSPVTDAGQGVGDANPTQVGAATSLGDAAIAVQGNPPLAADGKTTLQAGAQPQSVEVEVTLFDRAGDVLRQVRGTLSTREQQVVMTFQDIYGAYSGVVRFPGQTTSAVAVVARADPVTNLAILALKPPMPATTTPLPTLAALAHVTYEGTPSEQRDLAIKQARAQHWDEAISHWKRLLEMDDSLRSEVEKPLAEAYLKASTVAQNQGRHSEAHARLLEAIEWLPENGELRLRLAESFVELGEYREAIDQYWIASDLLPSQAPDIMRAVVRIYHGWGQELLRQGDVSAAASIFREALQLDNANGDLYFGLGLAEFHRLAFAAAIEAFEAAVAANPGLRSDVEPYLGKARALQGGPQTAVIDFPPGSRRIEVVVLLNGRLEVPFIIDTGASMTLMPAWAADTLGYRAPAASEWLRVQTAGGTRRLPYAALNRIAIQGIGVSNLPVLFGDLPGSDTGKGLLGMDFLRYFAMAVDYDLGRMTLRLK